MFEPKSDNRIIHNAVTTGGATAIDRIRASANIVFAVAQVLAAQVTAVMGITDIGTRSEQSPALFTPPGFTFAIWGIIFLGMAAYAIYQALPGNLANARLRRIGWWTATAMALNAAWELVTVEYGVVFPTVAIIFAMLSVLIRAFLLLHSDTEPTRQETGFVVFPVSIFAAWITVASIANSSSWLGNAGGFDGGPLSDGVWVAILALIGGLVGAIVIRRNCGNAFYAAVLCWAFAGIVYKGIAINEPLMTGGAALALMIVCAAFIAFGRKATRSKFRA
jgi:translocator protein